MQSNLTVQFMAAAEEILLMLPESSQRDEALSACLLWQEKTKEELAMADSDEDGRDEQKEAIRMIADVMADVMAEVV